MDEECISSSKKELFKVLQIEGKRLASEGDLEESLKKFELAKEICPTSKVLQRIDKLKEFIKKSDALHRRSQPASSTSSTLPPTKVSTKVSTSMKDVTANEESIISMNSNTVNESKVLNDIKNIQCHQKSSTKINEMSGLSPQSQLEFRKLKKEAKKFAYAGNYDDAVNTFKKALSICDCPSVKKYIEEVETVKLNNEADKLQDQSSEIKCSSASDSAGEVVENNATLALPDNAEEVQNFNNSVNEQKLTSDVIQEQCQETTHEELEKSVIERKLEEVKILYEEARELASDGNLTEALKLLKKSQDIYATQKVQKKVDKLEKLLSDNLFDPEDNKMIKIEDDFSVFHEIYNKLYPYQREGVAWMWKLNKLGKGGVLGDDMGLGKTFQIIAFLSGMVDADLVKHVLIIMPVSLLKNWEKEFTMWCPGISVHDFHSGSKRERERNLLRVQRRGNVLLTSYGMVLNNVTCLSEMDGREFVWDYVILDEGHKIKNPTKTTKAVYEIPALNRLVLTGTPIQNNLKELWSLYDFTHQGTLLGSLKTFKMQYETPITRSREKDATAGEKRLGSEMAENLKAVIKPYFLRRTKDEIWGKNDKDVDHLEQQMENLKISQLSVKKNDLILWTYMSESQITIYKDFLHSDAVKSILVSKRSPLVELTTLKKICDHPRLLSQRACFHLGLNGELQKEDFVDLDDESKMASSIDNVTDESLLKESGKLKLVIDLLENLKSSGHRTLVFSLSRKILDMIHRILTNKNWKLMRLDGTITKIEERERRIQRFQNDSSYPVFLLTTQVGGVGLTLTAADRVIIYDPSWNPATDAQAVDRVYRIGQEKDVIVYRLITCGTVEEKIYRRQIFKDSITRQATGISDPYRYFSKQELRELFSLENPHHSATQTQLHEMHSSQRRTYGELDTHIEFMKTLNIFGISDHDLMFTKEVQDNYEDNDAGAITDQFIKRKVAAAHELIKMEASVVAEGLRLAGTFNRPYQETIPVPKKGIKDIYKPPVLPDVIDLTDDVQCVSESNHQKKRSVTPKRTSITDIQENIANLKNEGISFDKEKILHSSPIQKSSLTASSPINVNNFELKKISYSEGVSNESSYKGKERNLNATFNRNFETDEKDCDEKVSSELKSLNVTSKEQSKNFERSIEIDTFCNIEKLRKSSFGKPSLQDEIESPYEDKDMNLNVTCNKDFDLEMNEKDYDGKVSSEVKSLDVTSKLEQFKANLTLLKMEDLADLSFENEAPSVRLLKNRKSCAASRSSMFVPESNASQPNSASCSISMDESNEDTSSDEEDSSNAASPSFVPDSLQNTPQTVKHPETYKLVHKSVNETPNKSLRFYPELLSKNSDSSDFSTLRKPEGSVRRITPLKVNGRLRQGDSSFKQAMASSIIISPEPSPKKYDIADEANSYATAHISSSDDDSPLKVCKKKRVRRVYSDSEESDENSNSKDQEEFLDNSNLDYQIAQSEHGHSESSDENEDSHSKDQESFLDNSNLDYQIEQSELGHSESSDENEDSHSIEGVYESNLENEVNVSNHSATENSIRSVNSDGENDDQSDLDRTFATCKDKAESSHEGSSLEVDDSDESGSVFSADE